MIPDGWRTIRIEELAEKVGIGPFGTSIKVDTFVSEGIPIISGSNLKGIRLKDDDYNFITIEQADRLHSANVYRGDVIWIGCSLSLLPIFLRPLWGRENS